MSEIDKWLALEPVPAAGTFQGFRCGAPEGWLGDIENWPPLFLGAKQEHWRTHPFQHLVELGFDSLIRPGGQ